MAFIASDFDAHAGSAHGGGVGMSAAEKKTATRHATVSLHGFISP